MPGIPVQLFEGSNSAKVTKQGAQVVAPFAYDLVVSKTLSTGGVAVNFYKPVVGFQFVVTGVLGPHSNAHGPNEFLHIPAAKNLTASVAEIIYDWAC